MQIKIKDIVDFKINPDSEFFFDKPVGQPLKLIYCKTFKVKRRKGPFRIQRQPKRSKEWLKRVKEFTLNDILKEIQNAD